MTRRYHFPNGKYNRKRNSDDVKSAAEKVWERARQSARGKAETFIPEDKRKKDGYAIPRCRLCKVGRLRTERSWMNKAEGYYVRRRICSNTACLHRIMTYELYPWCKALIALMAFQEVPKITARRRHLLMKRLAEALEALIRTGAYDRRGAED